MAVITVLHDTFEDGTLGAWELLTTGGTLGPTTSNPYAGAYSLRLTRDSVSTQRAGRVVTGLTIGREYTFRVAIRRNSGGTVSGISTGVSGMSEVAVSPTPGADVWVVADYTFTATATSHTLTARALILNNGSSFQIDEALLTYEGEAPVPDPDALAFVGTPTTYADGTGASATATLPKPEGLRDGDYLVAMLRNQANESPDFSPPPGWQRVGPAYVTPAASRKHSTFIHRVPSAAAEPGSYAFGVNQTGANRTVGMLAILRPSDPENTVAESGNSGVYGGSVVGGVRVAPGYTLDPVPGVALALGSGEFTAGNDHAPTTTPPGWDALGIIASSAGVTGSRTALVTYSRTYEASPIENAPIGWAVASAPSVESIYFTEEGGVDPEPPPGFSSVDQMLRTPGATWAHRGGSRDWPEMSEYAYQQSALAGYGALEFSAQRTSDGWWFGLHDNSLDRTSGVSGVGPINALTRAQVESYQNTLNDDGTPRPYWGLVDFLDRWTPTHVVIVDPKNALSHNEEFLDILDAHGGPSRIIWKWYGVGANVGAAALAAAARGYRTWGYFYEEDVANGNLALYQGNYSLLGMAIGAGLPAWEAVTSYGKPVTGHIAQTQEHYGTAITKGARMVQVSGVTAVAPVSASDDPGQAEGGAVASLTFGPATAVGETSAEGGATASITFGPATAGGEASAAGGASAVYSFGPAAAGGRAASSGGGVTSIAFGPAAAGGDTSRSGGGAASLTFGPATAVGQSGQGGGAAAAYGFGSATGGGSSTRDGAAAAAYAFGPASAGGSSPGGGGGGGASAVYGFGPATAGGDTSRGGGAAATVSWGSTTAGGSSTRGGGAATTYRFSPATAGGRSGGGQDMNCTWDIDFGACPARGDESPTLLASIAAQVSEMMSRWSGYLFGGCRTVRPLDPCGECRGGSCCGSGDCIVLHGASGVLAVRIDGEVVDPADYHFDAARRTLCARPPLRWPTGDPRHDVTGSLEVDIRVGAEPDAWALAVASELACELRKAALGDDCRLPDGATRITSQGITVELTLDEVKYALPSVVAWVSTVNPHRATAPALILSPEVRADRLGRRRGGRAGWWRR